jgi:hypothetical protein
MKDETKQGERKKIVKPTENALLDELIIIYLQKQRVETMTLESFYSEWYEYKTSQTTSTRTLRRHEQQWKNI